LKKFYELFLKNRYTHSTSLLELELFRDLIINGQFDSDLNFDKRIQVKILGHKLSKKSEMIDRQILKNNFETYALFAINQDILRIKNEQGQAWINASSKAKAAMLKYYRIICFGTPNEDSKKLLSYIIENECDIDMIPCRFYDMTHDEIIASIKIFEPAFGVGGQLEADLGK
tara:strand:+ start:2114 stop:2629 length:516 start_codon:yes stop_codon:yes gene_type:complete